MPRRCSLAVLAGAAVGAFFAPAGATPGSDGCAPDTCAAGGEAGDRGDDYAAHMQLRTGQRNNASGHAGPAKPVVTTYLTEFLKYKLWSGLLVRTADHGVDSDYVPATFWRWDIHVPNQFYMWDADNNRFTDTRAMLGYVVDPDKLGWEPSTLYAHDANACDSTGKFMLGVGFKGVGRCFYSDKSYTYDCPGAVAGDCGLGPEQLAALAGKKIVADAYEAACSVVGTPKFIVPDPLMGGAGNHRCQGCHFIQGFPGLFDTPKNFDTKALYQGKNCKCKCSTPEECRALAVGIATMGKDGGWAADPYMCWTDDTDLQVAMQNALWDTWRKKDPDGWASSKKYWGWSEVAVHQRIDEPQYYAANMIYMTPRLSNGKTGPQGLEALTDALAKDLDSQIETAKSGKSPTIKVGSAARGQHPGSDVVIARQNVGEGGTFSFEFFCQEFTPNFPGARYKICAKEKTTTDPGHCYLEAIKQPCQ